MAVIDTPNMSNKTVEMKITHQSNIFNTWKDAVMLHFDMTKVPLNDSRRFSFWVNFMTIYQLYLFLHEIRSILRGIIF